MAFRAAVRRALLHRRALILLSDFDGTLVPIVERPQDVHVSRTLRGLLTRLARHPRARVGIVSGRRLADLQRIVRIPGAAYAGCHGLEIAWRRARFRHPRAEGLRPLLRRVTRQLRRGTSPYPGVLVEPKGLTVSLHFRRARPEAVPALRRIVREILAGAPALELLAGKKVLELRPRGGRGKGEAVRLMRALLARSLGRRAPLTLYLGDDETDEEAFRALRGKALCVAVGRRPTRATHTLRSPAGVEELLGWLERGLATSWCSPPQGSSSSSS